MWPRKRRRRKNPFVCFRGAGGDKDGEPVNPDPDLRLLLDLIPYDDEEIERYDNSAVRALLKANPSAATARYEFAGCQGWRQFPLKRAVSLGASLDIVRRMAAAHPDAIHDRGMPGMSGSGATALHAACAYGSSFEIVKFLAIRYPEALEMTTRHGYLPLHSSCERGASADVVRFLVEMHPAALNRRNKLGRTPAECALRADGGVPNEEAMAALAYAPPAVMRARRSLNEWPGLGWVAGRKEEWRRKSWGGNRQSVRTAETQALCESCPEDCADLCCRVLEEGSSARN